ncbi:MAG: DUF4293 domain-containing protein [Bacteroidaceae bacterium]
MIQRIQSIYLLLSILFLVICFCFPLGNLAIGNNAYPLYKYGWCAVENSFHLVPALLGVLLLIIIVINIVCICSFKKRMQQIRHIHIITLFIVVFYVILVTITQLSQYAALTFNWSVILPFMSMILNFLSKRAIHKDEDLIRAADRIR